MCQPGLTPPCVHMVRHCGLQVASNTFQPGLVPPCVTRCAALGVCRAEFEAVLRGRRFAFSVLVHADESSPMVDFLATSSVLQVRASQIWHTHRQSCRRATAASGFTRRTLFDYDMSFCGERPWALLPGAGRSCIAGTMCALSVSGLGGAMQGRGAGRATGRAGGVS